jgi:3-phosphoshikimate 1-carboxyvinyltransferase
MSSKVEWGRLPTQVHIPGSKSYANRYLILAARWGNREIRSLPAGDDVEHLLSALRAIGLKIEQTDSTVRILNSFPECEHADLEINVGEGGTTARFLVAMLATGRRHYRLRLEGRLSERPWDELLSALRQAGAKAQLVQDCIEVQGPVDWSLLPREVDAARSTQFASALQLAGAREGIELVPARLASSQAYWDMTVATCREVATNPVSRVPLDWSSASYPLALAAIVNQPTLIVGLQADPLQADSVLGQWLSQRRCLRQDAQGTHVTGLKDLRPTQMDMSQCLDLAPTMAFICAHLEGVSVLSGLSGLVHKESDRLRALRDLLDECGVENEKSDGGLRIVGGVEKKPTHLHPPADHRLVMVASLFLACQRGGSLEHAAAVSKSFPSFFSALGFRK